MIKKSAKDSPDRIRTDTCRHFMVQTLTRKLINAAQNPELCSVYTAVMDDVHCAHIASPPKLDPEPEFRFASFGSARLYLIVAPYKGGASA